MKLHGKILVVTGAGNGIGRELALELARRGAQVAGVDIAEAALRQTDSLVAALGGHFSTHAVDLTDRAAVEALPDRVVARFGTVDGIINCAGIIQPFVPLKDLDYGVVERVFDVNWRGTLYMTKSFLPRLLSRPEAHIVNVASMGAFLPFPGQTVYGAAKAAVKLLSEGMQSELAGSPVRVTVVFPGAIGTDIVANSGVELSAHAEKHRKFTCPPDRAARVILDAVERDRSRVMVGKDARVLDILTRLAPVRAPAFIARQMKRFLPVNTRT